VYTNSSEAFDASYANGFRAFEPDLVMLKDGIPLLAHDGYESRFGFPSGSKFSEITSIQMLGHKFDGKFKPLLGPDFVRLVARHFDTTFLLDTKGNDVEIAAWLVQHMPRRDLDRLRPHVYSQTQIDDLRRIYRWKGFVIATYFWAQSRPAIEQAAIQMASANHITTFLTNKEFYDDDLRTKLEAVGVKYFYLQGFSSAKEISYWHSRGVGVFSDGWIAGKTPTVHPVDGPAD
jgi:hypothetical protein